MNKRRETIANLSIGFRHLFRDVSAAMKFLQKAPDFIKTHRLWEGLLRYRWLLIFSILGAIALALGYIMFVFEFWGDETHQIHGLSSLTSQTGLFLKESYQGYYVNGYKYLILFLLEVLIFHVSRRTIEIETHVDLPTNFSAFLQAQIRMLKVVIFSFVMETLFVVLGDVALGIFGAEWLEPLYKLVVKAFFMGFAVCDNYFEVYKTQIRPSLQYAYRYLGVCLTTGAVVYLCVFIPLVGPVIGSVIGAVVATLTLNKLMRIDGIHLSKPHTVTA